MYSPDSGSRKVHIAIDTPEYEYQIQSTNQSRNWRRFTSAGLVAISGLTTGALMWASTVVDPKPMLTDLWKITTATFSGAVLPIVMTMAICGALALGTLWWIGQPRMLGTRRNSQMTWRVGRLLVRTTRRRRRAA